MSYFANECFVCKTSKTLKICSRCNMISYCGSKHQKLDWPNHKEFCNAISFIMKELDTSHIYEKQKDSNSETWTKERERMSLIIESALGRPLSLHEEQMILMPRSCFICHDTRQEFLSHCPNCLCVNFCQNHQSSTEHNKDCDSLKLFHNLDDKINDPNKLRQVFLIIREIVSKIDDSPFPKSIDECLDRVTDDVLIKSCASNMLTMPLTFYNAIIKSNLQFSKELIFNVRCELPDPIVWEILLHYLPDLQFLKIIFVDQPESEKVKMKLCDDCSARGKKLILQMKDMSYENFILDELYIKPDILAFLPICDEGNLETISRVDCPLLLTCVTEMKIKKIGDYLKETFWTNLINYQGFNEFGAIEPLREWTNGGVGKINQFMILTNERLDKCQSKRFSNESPLLLKMEANEYWNNQYFFFSHICRGCRTKSSIITCKYCNLVFYCSEQHRREDWYHHKDLCKVVQKLLIDSGRRNIFAGEIDLMANQSESFNYNIDKDTWLRVKMQILQKIQLEIDRDLLNYEQQMFLFPKTCFACHESDLLKLYVCKCGIALCKIHKDYRGHKQICNDHHLSYLLHENEEIVEKIPDFRLVLSFENNLPETMQNFLQSSIVFTEDFTSMEKILLAELLTKPLTLLTALKKLEIETKSMVIHVIGSKNSKFVEHEYWELLFYWLKEVNEVKIIFLGLQTEAVKYNRCYSLIKPKNLVVESYPLTYDQFVKGKFFMKPNIIIGFDLDSHECELSTCDCITDFLTVRKMNVPFILTAGTKERAIKDHEKISEIFQKTIVPDFVYLNPFASLEPIRDFETECLRYLNKFVIIFANWEERWEKIHIFPEEAEGSRSFELERKLAELLLTKTEIEKEEEEERKEENKEEEDDNEAHFSSVFAASSELKHLIKDCGYKSKMAKSFDPDFQFVKNTKNDSKVKLNDENFSKLKTGKNFVEPDFQFAKTKNDYEENFLKLNSENEDDDFQFEKSKNDFENYRRNEIDPRDEEIDAKCREIFESMMNCPENDIEFENEGEIENEMENEFAYKMENEMENKIAYKVENEMENEIAYKMENEMENKIADKMENEIPDVEIYKSMENENFEELEINENSRVNENEKEKHFNDGIMTKNVKMEKLQKMENFSLRKIDLELKEENEKIKEIENFAEVENNSIVEEKGENEEFLIFPKMNINFGLEEIEESFTEIENDSKTKEEEKLEEFQGGNFSNDCEKETSNSSFKNCQKISVFNGFVQNLKKLQIIQEEPERNFEKNFEQSENFEQMSNFSKKKIFEIISENENEKENEIANENQNTKMRDLYEDDKISETKNRKIENFDFEKETEKIGFEEKENFAGNEKETETFAFEEKERENFNFENQEAENFNFEKQETENFNFEKQETEDFHFEKQETEDFYLEKQETNFHFEKQETNFYFENQESKNFHFEEEETKNSDFSKEETEKIGFEEKENFAVNEKEKENFAFEEKERENFNFENQEAKNFNFENQEAENFNFEKQETEDFHFEKQETEDFYLEKQETNFHFEKQEINFYFENQESKNFHFEEEETKNSDFSKEETENSFHSAKDNLIIEKKIQIEEISKEKSFTDDKSPEMEKLIPIAKVEDKNNDNVNKKNLQCDEFLTNGEKLSLAFLKQETKIENLNSESFVLNKEFTGKIQIFNSQENENENKNSLISTENEIPTELNNSNKLESQSENQKLITRESTDEESTINIDLYREILLLKKEVNRLKENEKKIESENLRLKEQVNQFLGGDK